MSEGSGLKQLVAEEVSDQLEVSELLDDGSIEDGIDGDEIGTAVGRQFGERIGRDIGASVGREVHETLSSIFEGTDEDEGEEEGEGEGEVESDDDQGVTVTEIRTELVAAIRRGFSEAIEDSSARKSVESIARNVTEGSSLEGVLERDESEDEAAEADGAETDEAEAAGESEPGGEAEPETEPEADTDEPEPDAESEPSADELADLRRETLEDFLGVMSYQDLQSVAKDVGVKANLSREEMTAEIIDTVADDADADADDEGEEGESTDGENDTDDDSDE